MFASSDEPMGGVDLRGGRRIYSSQRPTRVAVDLAPTKRVHVSLNIVNEEIPNPSYIITKSHTL